MTSNPFRPTNKTFSETTFNAAFNKFVTQKTTQQRLSGFMKAPKSETDALAMQRAHSLGEYHLNPEEKSIKETYQMSFLLS